MSKSKDKAFTPKEIELLRAKGMVWRFWQLIQRLPSGGMIVKNVYTGDFRLIEK